jgi:hypothetical protein
LALARYPRGRTQGFPWGRSGTRSARPGGWPICAGGNRRLKRRAADFPVHMTLGKEGPVGPLPLDHADCWRPKGGFRKATGMLAQS